MAVNRLPADGIYLMYLRRSRADVEAEARGAGETLAMHYDMLTELAGRLSVGILSSNIYREIVTGDTIADRPEIIKLLSVVESGKCSGVFVADVDRLARGDTMDQGLIAQTFLYSRTLIITPMKIYDPEDPSDREFFETKLFFARREYDSIKRRLQAGRISGAKAGRYMGSRAPYGYDRYKLPNQKGYSLKINEAESAIVRMIFDWYVHGISGVSVGSQVIANRLNDMGLQTKYGNPWISDTVTRILKSPTYLGMIQWNQRVQSIAMVGGVKTKKRVRSDDAIMVQGLHMPIVDKGLFDAAAIIRKRNLKTSTPVERKVANPFAGILICGVCGRRMTRQKANSAVPWYHTVKCPTSRCPTSGIQIALLESVVLGELREWVAKFSDPEPEEKHVDSPDPAADLIVALEKQRSTIDVQISRLRDLLEQGVYSVEVYHSRLVELNGRAKDLDDQISDLQKPVPALSIEEAITIQLPQISSVIELYDHDASAEDKNTLLKSVIDRIIYHKVEKTVTGQNPLSLLSLAVYPVIPGEDSSS